MSDWKPNDRAVCVDASPPDKGWGGFSDAVDLVKDSIYLVSGVGLRADGQPMLYLAPNPAEFGYGWRASRFRKLIPFCDRSEREQTELRIHKGYWRDHP